MKLYIAISAFLLSSTAAYSNGLRRTDASRHMSVRKLDEVAANYGYGEVDANTVEGDEAADVETDEVQDMEEKVEEMEEEVEEMEQEIEAADEAEDVEEGDNNEVEANTYGNANEAEDTEEVDGNEADEVQDTEEQVEEMEQDVEEMEQNTEDVNGGEVAADDKGESNEVEASAYGNANEAEEVQETEEQVEENAIEAEEVQDTEEEVEETEEEIEEIEEEIEEEANAYGDTNEAEEVQDMEEKVEELEEEIEEIEEEAEEEVSAEEKEEEAEEVEAQEYEMTLSGSIMACALVGAGLVAAKKKKRYSDEKHTSFLSMGDNEDASRFA